VGAAARVMKNMGMGTLGVVGRPVHRRAPARWMAASAADDVLAQAREYATLEEAVGDCAVVVGSTARRGVTRDSISLDVREGAHRIVEEAAAGRRVAFLMGREERGLTNEEIVPCHWVVRIPTADRYKVLNLAQATAVVCYELYLAARAWQETAPAEGARPPVGAQSSEEATVADLDGAMDHLKRVLWRAGFLDAASPDRVVDQFRRVFSRGRMTAWEARVLRGMLSSIELCMERPELRRPPREGGGGAPTSSGPGRT
jgi:TrmH family RNA methyltransferase